MINKELARAKLGDKTVLFADDELQVCVTWGKILRRIFGNVLIANNGIEGIEAYKQNSVDVVITDITMPIVNGLDMAQALLDNDKNCKIIFMTGHNETENMEKMALLGGISLEPISKITHNSCHCEER